MDEEIPINEKAIGFIITNTKADGMLTYDAVRRAWIMSESQLIKAKEAKYILAIEHGCVVDVFERHGEFRHSGEEGRYTFSPVPVADINIRRRYIGQRIRSYGSALVFIGYETENNNM